MLHATWDLLRSSNRNVRLYLLASGLTGFAYDGIYAVLLNLYLLRLGFGPSYVGTLHAAGLLANALLAVPFSGLGRRWGASAAMKVGISLRLAGLGLLPLSEALPAPWRAFWPLGAFVLAMLGSTLYAVNDPPFVMGATSLERRNVTVSARSALGTFSTFAGSLIGGMLPALFAGLTGASLNSPVPYRIALFLAAGALIPSVAAIAATRDVSAAQRLDERRQAGPFPAGPILFLGLMAVLRFGGYGAMRTFLNLYLDAALGLPTAQIGTLIAAGQLIAIPSALAMPPLARRWGRTRVLTLGTLGIALALLPLALIPRWWAAGLSYILVVSLFAISSPACTVFQMELVSAGWRPAMSGAYTMFSGLGWSMISLGGGYAVAALGYQSVFIAGAASAAGAALVLLAYFRRPRGELAQHPELDRA